jgi:hypothetical protein
MALLTGAVTALALSGAPGMPPGSFDRTGGAASPRTYTGAYTSLHPTALAGRAYDSFAGKTVPVAVPRTYTGAYTRLSPDGGPGRPDGPYTGKSQTIVSDFVLSDTIRVYVNEGPFSNLDLDVTEILAPQVADSLTGVNQGRSGSDIIRPRVTDTVQFLQKSGTLPKVGSDGIRVYVAEAATTNVSITGTDAIVPVVADAVTGVEKPAAVIVSDTITVVLSDLSFADAANSGRDFAGTDPILPVLGESVTVAISGEVDKIVFTAEPFGSIRITEI